MKDFLNIGIGNFEISLGNPDLNVKRILDIINNEEKTDFLLFSELCVTGYSCQDLFFQNELINNTNNSISYLLENNNYKGILIIGVPIEIFGKLINAALVIKNNKILGIVPKYYLPNNNEFQEERFFTSGFNLLDYKSIQYLGEQIPFGNLLFKNKLTNTIFGIEICEDMWASISPSNIMSSLGTELIFNLSASPDHLDKEQSRTDCVKEQSRKNSCAYIYSSNGNGESTSNVVFSNEKIIYSCGEKVEIIKDSNKYLSTIDLSRLKFVRRKSSSLKQIFKFSEFNYEFVMYKNVHKNSNFLNLKKNPYELDFKQCETIYNLIKKSILNRLNFIGVNKVILGFSGGIDSMLCLLILNNIFKEENINIDNLICVSMPGFATGKQSFDLSTEVCKKLDIKMNVVDIKDISNSMLNILNENEKNIVYENTQARMRTNVLMNLANKENGIVIGTSDMSEIALGFGTYNGDLMSMYSLISGLPKSSCKSMLKYFKNINPNIKECIEKVLELPISPELIENQNTEEILGSYEINDFILYRFLECGDSIEKIKMLVEKLFNINKINMVDIFIDRFFKSQFKRTTLPDGVKLLGISMSPRNSLRLPSDIRLIRKTK